MFLFLSLCFLSSCKSGQKVVGTDKNVGTDNNAGTDKNFSHQRKMLVSESGNIGLIQYSPRYMPRSFKPNRFYSLLNEKVQPSMTLNTVFYYMVKERNPILERQFLDSVAQFDYNLIMYYPDKHFTFGKWEGAKKIGDNKLIVENPLMINGKEFKVLTVEAKYDYRNSGATSDKSQPSIFTRSFQITYYVGNNYIFEMVTATNSIIFPRGFGGEKVVVDVASLTRFLSGYIRILR